MLAQQRVERRNGRRVDDSVGTLDGIVHERQCGEPSSSTSAARVRFGHRDREDQVERRRERLGGERQRIERLVRNTGVGETPAAPGTRYGSGR